MQAKTKSMEEVAMLVELQVNKDKTKIMKVKMDSSQSAILAKDSIEEIHVPGKCTTRGTEQDVKAGA